MVATGLLILKITGLIILGILGLILALLLLVLLVPVRYRAKGSYIEEIKGTASVSWLLHILSIRVTYDETLDVVIRIFGFPLGRERKRRKSKKDIGGDEPRETVVDREPVTEEIPWEDPKEEPKEEPRQEPRQASPPPARAIPVEPTKGKKKNPFSFQPVCDKLKAARGKKDEFFTFIQDEANKKTLALLWRQLKAIIKHILPQKITGWLKFGFDDPYTTGQVLMYISPFYRYRERKFRLIPVFETAVLEGDLFLKGRIRIGTLLILCIRVLFDKNMRTLLKKWR